MYELTRAARIASISPNPSRRAFRNVRKNSITLRIDDGSCTECRLLSAPDVYDTKEL